MMVQILINSAVVMISLGIGAFYLKSILTTLEHATNRRKWQFRMVDVLSLTALLSISFAVFTSLMTWSVLANPDNAVAGSIAYNLWLVPAVLTPLLAYFSIRELESLSVDHVGKRVIFVIVVAPIAASFALMLSFSGMVLFQCFELPANFPSPFMLGLLAIPMWPLLKAISNWCLLASTTAVVQYVE